MLTIAWTIVKTSVARLPAAAISSTGTAAADYRCSHMSDDPLQNMRERIERCRRLAEYANDPRTTEALLQMAEQGEIDLARLLAERAKHDEE